MLGLAADIRYGMRRLNRERGVVFVAVLTLALGIGLNSAIFSLIDAMLLRPVPYPQPDRLVFLTEWSEQVNNMSFSVANYKDLREQTTSFDGLAALRSANYTFTGAGEPERLDGRQVTAEFFPALGLEPLIGRVLEPADDRVGAEPVAVLSEPFWARRFARDPGVVGQSLLLDGVSTTVVGVVPAHFHGNWQRRDVFTSLLRLEDQIGGPEQRGSHPGIYVVGRLQPDASVESARTEVEGVAGRLATQYPDSNAGQTMTLRPLVEAVVGDARSALLVLLAAVVVVLLIACANVAHLLLARGAVRQRELAVRTALGASRGRVIRQLLTESVLLSVAGGALGLLVGWGSLHGLLALIPEDAPGRAQVGLHGGVLTFTVLVSLATGILFGLAPALQLSRIDPNHALREGGRSLLGGGSKRLRHGLVVAEVALSLVLLVGAGLLLRSFQRVLDADPGFDPAGTLSVAVSLPSSVYDAPEKLMQFNDGVLERVRALPGVRAAGATLPLLGGWQESFRVEGRPEPAPGQQPSTDITRITPGYVQAMGVRLLAGRDFDQRDTADAPPVCLVDTSFVSAWWPNEDPLGKRLRFGDDDDPWMEVVGVVAHVKNYGVDQDSRVETYVPFAQRPHRFMTFVLRSDTDPTGLSAGVRRAVLDVDPAIPVFDVATLDDTIADAYADRRIAALLTGSFAVLALLLAAVGLYGVMAYSVAQRTGEIGVRVALGAERADIVRLVVGNGLRLTVAGVALGALAAVGVGRLVAAMLFETRPHDPPTFLLTATLLTLTGVLACVVPARRALRVEPNVALREE